MKRKTGKFSCICKDPLELRVGLTWKPEIYIGIQALTAVRSWSVWILLVLLSCRSVRTGIARKCSTKKNHPISIAN